MAVETNDKLVTQREAHLTVTFGDNSRLVVGAVHIDSHQRQGLIGGANFRYQQGRAPGWASALRSSIWVLRGSVSGHSRSALRTRLWACAARNSRSPTSPARPVRAFPTACAIPMWGFTRAAVEVTNPLNPKAAPVIATAGYETTVPCEAAARHAIAAGNE